MANEKIIFDTEVKVGNSVGSVKSLKAELRAITNELGTLEQGSEAFVKAAKKAGELKDQIGDVKDTINAFNPEAKFQALAGAVGIAANGFSAMQGAMALMGAENEELNKTIAKTQGAIALATGLNGLLGMKDAFNLLKLTAVTSFNSIKVAIGSTGIGLIVVAVGLLVSNWETLTKAIQKSFPIFNDMGKIFDKLREVAYGAGEVIKNAILMPFKVFGKLIQGEFKGALEEIKNGYNIIGNYEKGAEKGREANRQAAAEDRLKKLIEEKEKELEVHKAAGKDTYKEELALNKLKQDAAKDNAKELEKLQQEEKVLRASHQKDIEAKQKEHNAKMKKLATDSQAAFDDLIKKTEDEMISDYEKELAYDKNFQELVLNQKYKNLEEDAKIEAIKKENREADATNEIATAKYLSETKLAINNAYLNSASQGIAALKSLAGGNEELQAAALIAESAVSIAKMVIANNAANVAIVAQGAALSIPTLGASVAAATALVSANNISTAIGVAATIAATSAGLSQLGKGGAPSMGGSVGGVTAPSAPRIPQSFSGASLRPNSEVITNNKGEIQKVIVTETDITQTQNKVKGIIRKATIR